MIGIYVPFLFQFFIFFYITYIVKPAVIVEIGLEQVKENIQRYLNQKSQTNKQITRAATIKAIKKSLNIAAKDKSWDEDIWSFAINLSKSIRKRTTPKTIYFQ